MSEDIRKTAEAVLSNVLETMFFVAVDPFENDQGEDPSLKGSPNFFKGEIGFKGKYSGLLTLYLPTELTKTMAVNFMGTEENVVPEAQAMDMVGELCNILCGNLLSRLDKKTGYVLTTPRTVFSSPQEMEVDVCRSGMAINFSIEGERAKLCLHLESAAR